MSTAKQFEKCGEGLLVRAPGKINLSLLVKGKREDGFHDIESIMAKIDLYDEIRLPPTADAGQPFDSYLKADGTPPSRADNGKSLVITLGKRIVFRYPSPFDSASSSRCLSGIRTT